MRPKIACAEIRREDRLRPFMLREMPIKAQAASELSRNDMAKLETHEKWCLKELGERDGYH